MHAHGIHYTPIFKSISVPFRRDKESIFASNDWPREHHNISIHTKQSQFNQKSFIQLEHFKSTAIIILIIALLILLNSWPEDDDIQRWVHVILLASKTIQLITIQRHITNNGGTELGNKGFRWQHVMWTTTTSPSMFIRIHNHHPFNKWTLTSPDQQTDERSSTGSRTELTDELFRRVSSSPTPTTHTHPLD